MRYSKKNDEQRKAMFANMNRQKGSGKRRFKRALARHKQRSPNSIKTDDLKITLDRFNQFPKVTDSNVNEFWDLRDRLEKNITLNINSNTNKVDRSISSLIKHKDKHIEIVDNKVILYHGSDLENIQIITKEGLKGGDNLTGGNRGEFEVPTLYITPDKHIADKYGHVIEIRIPLREYYKLYYDKVEISNDGLGDRVYILTAEDIDKDNWSQDTIIIKPDYIYSFLEEKG